MTKQLIVHFQILLCENFRGPLAGLPTNAVCFAVLPPQLIYVMENYDVKQALQIFFGCIIDLYEES